MAMWRINFIVHHGRVAVHPNTLGQLALLFHGKEDVTLHAKNEDRHVVQAAQTPRQRRHVGMCAGVRNSRDVRAALGARWGVIDALDRQIAIVAMCLHTRRAQLGQGVVRHIKQVHGLRDVDKGVGVVLEAELLALVVEVRFHQKVRA